MQVSARTFRHLRQSIPDIVVVSRTGRDRHGSQCSQKRPGRIDEEQKERDETEDEVRQHRHEDETGF